MTKLHIVTGDKGNVGKSAWCSAMIEYYRDQERPLELIDADSDSHTLKKTYKSALPIKFSDDIAYAPITDSIYEVTYKEAKKKSEGGDVLVDLPAGGERFLNKWIDECAITERAKEDKITIVKWWVSDSDSNSISLFEKDVAKYPSIKYVFLKNMGRSSVPQWDSFTESKTIKALQKKGRIQILEVPGIPSMILDQLRVAGAKLIDVINDKKYEKYGLSKGMRVRGWVMNTSSLIHSVMPVPKKKAPKKETDATVAEQPEVSSATQATTVAKELKASSATQATTVAKEPKASATA